jgi:hypothetical protein
MPPHPEALSFLGTLALHQGKPGEGVALLEQSLKLHASQPLVLCNLGAGLRHLGRLGEALACYDRAIALKHDIPDAFCNRALVLIDLERWEEALASCDRAIVLRPGFPEAHNNRGIALQRLRRFEEALTCYDRAIELRPDYAAAYSNRGLALCALGRWEEALASCDRSIALDPGQAIAHNNRGIALQSLQRLDEAMAAYDRAIALQPEYVEAHNNRGFALRILGRGEEARACHDRALALKPDCADALWGKAQLDLSMGAFESGWKLYESRWRIGGRRSANDHFTVPLWLGKEPLAGRRILIHCEQGLGDTVQFCRYVPKVAQLGAHVIFAVQQPLIGVMRTLDGVGELVAEGYAAADLDYHCPLLSLPLAFGTTLETIPGDVPYLRSDSARVAYWKQRLGPRTMFRVGLAWSGGFRPGLPEFWSLNERRNIPLSKFEPLDVEGVEFYSLQKGPDAVAQLRELQGASWQGPRVIDYTDEFADFAATAALIDNLDLVISVDTSTAHLAAALGKPTWILNRYDSCWRWMLEGSETPWYPTARLFRQTTFGDWDSVIRQVRQELERQATGAAARGYAVDS